MSSCEHGEYFLQYMWRLSCWLKNCVLNGIWQTNPRISKRNELRHKRVAELVKDAVSSAVEKGSQAKKHQVFWTFAVAQLVCSASALRLANKGLRKPFSFNTCVQIEIILPEPLTSRDAATNNPWYKISDQLNVQVQRSLLYLNSRFFEIHVNYTLWYCPLMFYTTIHWACFFAWWGCQLCRLCIWFHHPKYDLWTNSTVLCTNVVCDVCSQIH